MDVESSSYTPSPSSHPPMVKSIKRKSSNKNSPKDRTPVDFPALSHAALLEQAEEYRKKYKKMTHELNRIRNERNLLRDKYQTHKSEKTQWEQEKDVWIERAKEWGQAEEEKKRKELDEMPHEMKILILEEQNKALTKTLQERVDNKKILQNRVETLEKQIEDVFQCDRSSTEHKLPVVFQQRFSEFNEKISYYEMQNSMLLQQLEDKQFEIREMQRAQKRNSILSNENNKDVTKPTAINKPSEISTPKSAKKGGKISANRLKRTSIDLNDRKPFSLEDFPSSTRSSTAISTPQFDKMAFHEGSEKLNSNKRPACDPNTQVAKNGSTSWGGKQEMGRRSNSEIHRNNEGWPTSSGEPWNDRSYFNEPHNLDSIPKNTWENNFQPEGICHRTYPLMNPGDRGYNQPYDQGYFQQMSVNESGSKPLFGPNFNPHRAPMNDQDLHSSHQMYNGPAFNQPYSRHNF